ncbi:16525_t:CDS:2 [Funneliformis caledonium]|uniref:16525_t:CDS:1 n=1 Tax=Funneliformis caledonium TaxID=1117310 RepID=A0A9N8Z4I7_9GLOM|nr:16525_t:CDS:2 [Funneliformis caledonium]
MAKDLLKNYGWRIYFSTINDWIYVIEEIISFCYNNRTPFCYYGCLLLSCEWIRFDVRSKPSSQGSGKKVAVVDTLIGSSANTSSNLNENNNNELTTDARMNATIEDARNGTSAELPGSLSGHEADDFIEQIMEESEQMITLSEEPSTST